MPEPNFRFSPRPNQADQIQWKTFDAETFEEARKLEKPVLLSISAVWCHWCHVMDETSYSDPEVIAKINQSFIPIRVDNDQRPDINLRYNMGGWPTTAVLTPSGEILTGGTYFTPEQMQSLLDQVVEYWNQNREEVLNARAEVKEVELDPKAPEPTPDVWEPIIDAVRQQFDRAYGGLGAAPKFPHPDVWELCLVRFLSSGDAPAAGMAIRTLDAMAGSNLYDQIGGGFFRYSTTREWTIPHFEKMLEDNAQLARLYLRGFQVLGDETYRVVAQNVLTWTDSVLMNDNGLWGGSQDADEAYYQLPQEEREKKEAPFVDPVIYTNWNAQMISAHLLAAALINPQAYTPVALTALEALWDRMWDEKAGLYHFDDGTPQLPGMLTDVAHLAHTLVDGYEFTGDRVYLDRAAQLLSWADEHLWQEVAYIDFADAGKELPGRLAHAQKPLNENCLMATLMWRMGLAQNDPALQQRAKALIGAFSKMALEQGIFGAAWALASETIAAPLLSATVIEGPSRPATDLRRTIFGVFDRNRIVRTIATDSKEFAASDYPDLPVPALYLCREETCAQPVTEPEGILAALQQLAGIVPDENPAT